MYYGQFRFSPSDKGGTKGNDFKEMKLLKEKHAREKAAELSDAAKKLCPLLKKTLATRIKYTNIGTVKEGKALSYQICDDAAIVLGFLLAETGLETHTLRGLVPYAFARKANVEHSVLAFDCDGGSRIILDPTYQQFLSPMYFGFGLGQLTPKPQSLLPALLPEKGVLVYHSIPSLKQELEKVLQFRNMALSIEANYDFVANTAPEALYSVSDKDVMGYLLSIYRAVKHFHSTGSDFAGYLPDGLVAELKGELAKL